MLQYLLDKVADLQDVIHCSLFIVKNLRLITRCKDYLLQKLLDTRRFKLSFYKIRTHQMKNNPVDTGRKLNVHKTFRRRPGSFRNVLYMFNLRPVSTWNSKLLIFKLSLHAIIAT